MPRQHTRLSLCKWQDLRPRVMQVNTELAEQIDKLDIQFLTQTPLLVIRYPFGSAFIKQGQLQLPPAEASLVAPDQPTAWSAQQHLTYATIPIMLNLHNTCEAFIDENGNFLPIHLFQPGELFGIWEFLDPSPFKQQLVNWHVTAGARSVFMLPKVTDMHSHARLRQKYAVTPFPPKTLAAQHALFSQIAKHANFPQTWYNEILLFPNAWIEHLQTSDGLALQHFFLQTAWQQSIYQRNQLSYSLVWQLLSDCLQESHLKPKIHLIEIIKHLLYIGTGGAIAFAPATDDSAAPINDLQQVYLQDYCLKHYVPTLMQPARINIYSADVQHVYYSLQMPTITPYRHHKFNSRNTLQDLRDLRLLMQLFFEKLPTDTSPLAKLITQLKFTYYHSDADLAMEINPATRLAIDDPRFLHTQHSDGSDRSFADAGSFARGCIRITYPGLAMV